MKIFVIHGEDVLGSYARLTKFTQEAKKRGWEVTDYSLEAATNPSLFGKERFFVLKDYKLLSKNDIKILSKYQGNLVIYFEGVLPAAFIGLLPEDAKKEFFELPKIIFRFLETFSLKLFHQLIETQPPELVFSMLVRQLRDLYWLKADPKGSLFPAWKAERLRSQASKFSLEQLEIIFSQLSEIDYEVKTGRTNLVTALDLLIIKNLQ